MTRLVNILNNSYLLIDRSFNTRPLCSSFALVATIMTLLIMFINPGFDTNDDIAMMFVANGYYYDQPSEHLIFTKIIIGLILKFLYTAIPDISWYALYLYFFHIVASSLILYTLVLARKNITHFILLIYTLTLFEIQMLMNLQFTSTSLILGFSSILYYFILTKKKPENPWIPIIAGILLGMAGVIRNNSFWGTLVFSLPLLLSGFKHIPLRKNTIFTLSALCVFFGSSVINNFYYQFDPAWKDYFEFNQVRGSLHGTQKLAWSDDMPGILKKVNWSKNDYHMFEKWFFTDSSIFSKDALKTIYKLHTNKVNVIYNWQSLLPEIIPFSKSVKGRMIYGLLMLVSLIVFTSNKRRTFLLSFFLWHLLVCIYLFIYIRLPLRVSLPSFLFFSLSSLLFSENRFFDLLQNQLLSKVKHKIIIIIIIIIFIFFVFGLYPVQEMLRESKNNETNHQQLISVLKTLNTVNTEGIFVVWGGSLNYEYISPFVTRKDLPKLKLIGLGWRIYSPPYLDWLRKLEIDDLYEAIATRNDLYLIATDDLVQLYEKYMLEHYGKEVKLRSVLTLSNSDDGLEESEKIKVFHNLS